MATLQKFLSWQEPAAFRNADRGGRFPPTWAHVVFLLVFVLFAALPWLYTPKDGLASYIGMPVMGLVAGAVAGYGMAWSERRTPSRLSFDNYALYRDDSSIMLVDPMLSAMGYGRQEWLWRTIKTARVEPANDHGVVLIITLHGEGESNSLGRLGIAKSVDVAQIRELFEGQGVEWVEAIAEADAPAT